MSEYLFIQSQDPFIEARTSRQYELAGHLAMAGNRVRMILVQNGVCPARQGATCKHFASLIESRVEILADEFSLD